MPTTTKQTFPEKVALEAVAGHPSASVGVTGKTGFVIKPGDVVGKITADGKYRRRSATAAAGTGFSTGSAVGQVDDASVFAAGDVLKNAAGQTLGTVLSINTAANPDTVTLTANSGQNVAAGAEVFGSDGSQVSHGISETETDGTADVPAVSVIIRGLLVESRLRGLSASAKTELAGASLAGGIFKF